MYRRAGSVMHIYVYIQYTSVYTPIGPALPCPQFYPFTPKLSVRHFRFVPQSATTKFRLVISVFAVSSFFGLAWSQFETLEVI